MMFWWLEKNKDISNLDMVTKLFDIMTGSVSNESRANLKRITIKELTTRAFPVKWECSFILVVCLSFQIV